MFVRLLDPRTGESYVNIWPRSAADIASAIETVHGAHRHTLINCWRGLTRPGTNIGAICDGYPPIVKPKSESAASWRCSRWPRSTGALPATRPAQAALELLCPSTAFVRRIWSAVHKDL